MILKYTCRPQLVSQFVAITTSVTSFSAIEEETIIGGQGDQQIIVKSGPRKPKLENLTLSQWSIANLAILYKLVRENKLGGDSMLDYLSYTTKVYQLVQRFSLPSVLLYDQIP